MLCFTLCTDLIFHFHGEFIHTSIMETLEGRRRNTKGGDIVRFEPQGLRLVNADPTIRASFEQVGCIRFCEKIQGYNMKVEKEFPLSFNGIGAKVGNIQFQVSEDTIVSVTEIPAHGEQWFKGMQLDLSCYHVLMIAAL
jgi:hypothetical protein